jgi:hypothetical protein
MSKLKELNSGAVKYGIALSTAGFLMIGGCSLGENNTRTSGLRDQITSCYVSDSVQVAMCQKEVKDVNGKSFFQTWQEVYYSTKGQDSAGKEIIVSELEEAMKQSIDLGGGNIVTGTVCEKNPNSPVFDQLKSRSKGRVRAEIINGKKVPVAVPQATKKEEYCMGLSVDKLTVFYGTEEAPTVVAPSNPGIGTTTTSTTTSGSTSTSAAAGVSAPDATQKDVAQATSSVTPSLPAGVFELTVKAGVNTYLKKDPSKDAKLQPVEDTCVLGSLISGLKSRTIRVKEPMVIISGGTKGHLAFKLAQPACGFTEGSTGYLFMSHFENVPAEIQKLLDPGAL